MPTIHLSKKSFEQYVGKKLPADKLKDRISYLGTDLESIENDTITVEIFPNRPDLLSVQGFARAFSSFINHKTGLRKYHAQPAVEKVIIEKAVSSIRPYTSCAIVKGLHFDDEKIKEVIDIQEKLHITFGRNRKKVAIGIYPLEKIALPITYTAKKPKDIVFQPLDADKEMNALQILEEHPTGKKYAHLLEGKEVFPVFLDGNNEVLSLPPIINSAKTGRITEQTKDVFIECSGFDYELLSKALNMIITSLADMSGQIHGMKLIYPTKTITSPHLAPISMKIDTAYINKWLGTTFKDKDIKQFLEQMGYGFKEGKALIPCYRADILHQVDLAEDIAIAYGYENFSETIPNVATTGKASSQEILKGVVSEILSGLGFQECMTYNLTSEDNQSRKMNADVKSIKLSNSISLEYDVLRSWVLPSLVEVLSNNKHQEYPQRLFTFGTTFTKDSKEETGIREEQWLAIASSHERADYTEARQVLEYILSSLGVTTHKVEEHESGSFIPGRVATIYLNKKIIATIGELHPSVLENWELEMPVSCVQMNMHELFGQLEFQN